MKLEDITSRLAEEQVKADKELVTDIQIRLRGLGLYPGGKLIDGDYGNRTRNGIKNFCDSVGLTFPLFDTNFARKLIITKQLSSLLAMGNNNREQTFQNLLAIAKASQTLPFLHRDIQNSKYITEIPKYPERVQVKHNTHPTPITAKPYPKRGVIPTIENQGLNFLHADITEACVCIGNFENGTMQARWLGKNALEERQFWSATKIIPVLNVVCDANTRFPNIDIGNCYVNDRRNKFTDLILDIVNYRVKITSSNAAAATLKLFQTPIALENWVKNITGNQQLSFRGGYGETPFINQPKLIDGLTQKQVLTPPANRLDGNNLVSAYDMTRLVSMLGWHLHLNEDARLPGAQWHSLENVIIAMGNDRARYIEVAIETLGLENVVLSPVIISKLGNGFSESRGTNEITYVAFAQFIDESIKPNNEPPKFRTLAMTLRGAVKPPRTFADLDARMAAEVSEIIRRVVTEQLN